MDRGDFSLECIIIVLLLKILYPKNIFFIRGNHEFEMMCYQFGFKEELSARYPNDPLVPFFVSLFNDLPLAALVDNIFFCVHGGIGPNFYNLSQFSLIQRPLQSSGQIIPDTLLWSDPTEEYQTYTPSHRGLGYLFGIQAVNDFCKNCGIQTIIRGHECIANGVREMFSGRLYTVFSASNYCNISGNQSGVILIDKNKNLLPYRYPVLEYLHRSSVRFNKLTPLTNHVLNTYKTDPQIVFKQEPESKLDPLQPSKRLSLKQNRGVSTNDLHPGVHSPVNPTIILPKVKRRTQRAKSIRSSSSQDKFKTHRIFYSGSNDSLPVLSNDVFLA